MPVVHRNSPRYSNEAGRRKRQKRLNNAVAPLLLLLPENVAVQRVIFITNEINNAAICPLLRPLEYHIGCEMGEFFGVAKQCNKQGGFVEKWKNANECHTGKGKSQHTHR